MAENVATVVVEQSNVNPAGTCNTHGVAVSWIFHEQELKGVC